MNQGFIGCLGIVLLVLCSGCLQPPGSSSVQLTPALTPYVTAPVVLTPGSTATVSPAVTTRVMTTTKTPTPSRTPTVTPAVPVPVTPEPASYRCTGDSCGTLTIRLSCNPKMQFKRVAILKIKNAGNTSEVTAAVAAMGNNFEEVLPDGSVIPIQANPGRYTLVLLDANNLPVPEMGRTESIRTTSVQTGKTTRIVFTEDC